MRPKKHSFGNAVWEYSQEMLKEVRPQMTLHLWHPMSLGVDQFFNLTRLVRKVELVPQPVFEEREVLATITAYETNDGDEFAYLIQIKEDLSLSEQVLCFLHEIVHIAFWKGMFLFKRQVPVNEIEYWVELMAFQFLETCDYYAFSSFLGILQQSRTKQ